MAAAPAAPDGPGTRVDAAALRRELRRLCPTQGLIFPAEGSLRSPASEGMSGPPPAAAVSAPAAPSAPSSPSAPSAPSAPCAPAAPFSPSAPSAPRSTQPSAPRRPEETVRVALPKLESHLRQAEALLTVKL